MHHPDTKTDVLVFTDLDGSLLDHFTYSADAAMDALRVLQGLGIPVIFNTSKTAAECEAISAVLGLNDPFIVENGSAVLYPKHRFTRPADAQDASGNYWRVVLGATHAQIRQNLDPLKANYQFLTLTDSSLADICQATGLSMTQASRARNRQFSEPMIWQDSDDALALFAEQLSRIGLSLQKGGRFYHVLGKTDKGHALLSVTDTYTKRAAKRDAQVMSVALGDGENDISMLRAADYPVLLRSPAHALPPHAGINNLHITAASGPAGWSEAIHSFLSSTR